MRAAARAPLPRLPRSVDPAGSMEQALLATLRCVMRLARASGGALAFRPPGRPPVAVAGGVRPLPASLRAWLRASVLEPVPRVVLAPASPPGRRAGGAALLRAPLGTTARPVGAIALLAPRDRLSRGTLSPGFLRDLGAAIDRLWHLQQRTLRMAVLNDITRIGVSTRSQEDLFRAFVDGLARLVRFDGISVALLDPDRGDFEVMDLSAPLPHAPHRSARVPLEGTLVARVVASGDPLRVEDLRGDQVPRRSRERFTSAGYRSALLVPLVSGGGTFAVVTLAAARPGAFTDGDVEVVAELARPLASAMKQRRLLDESRRRAEELSALYGTSRLVTSRLDVPSVLDAISRAVLSLTGADGCGIGLVQEGEDRLTHVAAHGFSSEEWRALSLPLGEGIIGRCAQGGTPIRVDDVLVDARSAHRHVDEREGIRSMLCVPLLADGRARGVISAIAKRPGAFTAHHQRVLEAFAEQAGMAIHNARLFEESLHRARETRALLEAGRSVTASLDVDETIRVILEQARSVLGVESCGLMTVDPESGELVSQASLDLPPPMVSRIRVREGEGIAGLAVAERRPIQSADLSADPRVRYPELPLAAGFRSMLAVPLRVGDRAIGAVSVFRRDVHRFTSAEEEVLLALADQAAIALEHARLYAALEVMVAERTRELESQKRFVEVVLETLPLGVFVLDAELTVVRANREGGRTLGCEAGAGCRFLDLVGPTVAARLGPFLREAFALGAVRSVEEEMAAGGEAKTFRLTAAPFEPAGARAPHLVVLVEDITRAKRLEQQMLLTERLTTAGRLAAGVAHELNNPLATIAGCAEALVGRLREGELGDTPAVEDFRHYLALIEEETYRCKEITGSLLQFVREPGSRRAPTDVNELIQKTVELLSHQARFGGATLDTALDPRLPPVTINEGQMRQVFLGLAANALEAMDGHGTLTIRSRLGRDEVEVEFEDQGPGIPDEALPRIFDPFFTTKPPGQGTGLGLAIAQGIVADHGGRIEVESHAGKGSVFLVVLPT